LPGAARFCPATFSSRSDSFAYSLAAGHTLLSQLHDVSAPRRLATWLAATSGISLADTIKSPSATAAENAALLRQLADTGRFGRWAARWLGPKSPDQRP
jgi:hypothetical protein